MLFSIVNLPSCTRYFSSCSQDVARISNCLLRYRKSILLIFIIISHVLNIHIFLQVSTQVLLSACVFAPSAIGLGRK